VTVRVTGEPADHERPSYRVLSTRTIGLAALALVLIGVGLATWLIFAYGGGSEADRARLEALRTAGTIVVGTGGAAALWLAARRQRTGEIALKQKDLDHLQAERAFALQERAAKATEDDAAQRRVTDLYTKAVEQVGSDKAAVRLGGMYALERLAQNVPDQRQVVVNVLCAYLRMPTDAPGEARHRDEEQQVRLTAQRILTDHLRPGEDAENPPDSFWPDSDLDLTGAMLTDLDLSRARVRTARFTNAQFLGDADFSWVRFDGVAEFGGARFHGKAGFEEAVFDSRARFVAVGFDQMAIFREASFNRGAGFDESRFTETAAFGSASFGGPARFDHVAFDGGVTFHNARFVDDGVLTERSIGHFRTVSGGAWFGSVLFSGGVRFGGVMFDLHPGDPVGPFRDARVRLIDTELVPRRRTRRIWPAGFEIDVPEDPANRVIEGREGEWGFLRRPVRTGAG